MKKIILTLGMLPLIGFGQSETINYFNNFNVSPNPLLTQDIGFVSFTSSTDDYSYDGSPVGVVGSGWVITDTISVLGLDEINISLRVKRLYSYDTHFTLEYSPIGSDEWVTLWGPNNGWITRDYYKHLFFTIEDITFSSFTIRFRDIPYPSGATAYHYVDDLIIKGPTTEQSMECGFDTDNNGTISAADLMNFLQYFDVEVNCN